MFIAQNSRAVINIKYNFNIFKIKRIKFLFNYDSRLKIIFILILINVFVFNYIKLI